MTCVICPKIKHIQIDLACRRIFITMYTSQLIASSILMFNVIIGCVASVCMLYVLICKSLVKQRAYNGML